MKIIVFSNKKGGVGKTTSALCFATALSTLSKKILCIDMDSQANFTAVSGGEKEVEGTFDFMKGESLNDVIQKNVCYDFIGADKRLSKAEIAFDTIGRESILRRAMTKVSGYDYCIIDTPPAMGILTLNALTAADEVIICCQADAFSVQGLAEFRQNIEGIQQNYNTRLKVAGILMTRHNPRTTITKQLEKVFGQAARAMNTRVFNTAIRENTAIKEAQAMKQNIFDYAPMSNGALDYMKFIKEYLGDL